MTDGKIDGRAMIAEERRVDSNPVSVASLT